MPPLRRRRPAALRLTALEDRRAPAVNLVADLNTLTTPFGSGPAGLVRAGGVVYFQAADETHGRELWKSDGTAAGTVLVRDLNPGPADSTFGEMAVVSGTLFFTTTTGGSLDLWRSNGTAAGTFKLRDLAPARLTFSNPANLTAAGGRLYFAAADPARGAELWTTDGTVAGTRLVRDVSPGPTSSFPFGLTAVGGALYFAATDPAAGRELWRATGTRAVRVKDVNPGRANASPAELTAVGGTLYFTADDGTHGAELWKTDGTARGTVLVKDFIPGPGGEPPGQLTSAGGKLYFTADDLGGAGRELWTSDGTVAGTTLVQDVRPGNASSSPGRAVAANGVVYFIADDGTTGIELYGTDGTPGGTARLTDFAALHPNFEDLTEFAGRLFFTVDDPVAGRELWTSDGTGPGTARFLDLRAGPTGSVPRNLLVGDGRLFFSADDGVVGREPWSTDGTPGGTGLVRDVHARTFPLSANPVRLAAVGDDLYFSADDGVNGYELWGRDGATGVTALVADIRPGRGPTVFDPTTTDPVVPDYFCEFNGLVYFAADDGVHGNELWRTDGTAAGTWMVKDMYPGPIGGEPFNLKVVAGKLYMLAEDPDHGAELWTSDGTEAGTVMVKDLVPGPDHSVPLNFTELNGTLYFTTFFLDEPSLWTSDGTEAGTVPVVPAGTGPIGTRELVNVNGTLFFSAADGTHGRELWTSDGTAGGTGMLKDINPSGFGQAPADFTPAGGRLFFTANDGTHGHEVWVSDGTEAGTVMVKDLEPTLGSFPDELTAAGGRVFFTAQANNKGGLWVTDGTDAGTVRLFQADARPTILGLVDGVLYFAGADPAHGLELWKTDGTAAGTVLARDIIPGPAGSTLEWGTVVGGDLYFSAFDPDHGRELWTAFDEPTATIGPAAGQADPAGGTSVAFEVAFSEPVFGFDPADVDLSASTTGGPLIAAVTPLGPTGYRVEVTGMAGAGQVIARIPIGAAVDAHGHGNPVPVGDDTIDYARAGFVGLTADDYEVAEGGSVVVTARRAGGSVGTASVNYALVTGSALAGADFADLSGTLTWADGETGDRQVAINIPADGKSEGRETFAVVLTGLTGSGEAPAAGTLTAPVGILPSDPLHSGDRFTDDDGDTATITLTGPGTVSVYLSDPDGDGDGPIELIEPAGTSADRSVLTVRVTPAVGGDGVVPIGTVVGGDLKALSAARSDLVGGLDLAVLRGLAVRDIRAGADVTLGGTPAVKTTITAADIGDGTTIRTGSAIGRLQAARFGAGRVEAPSLGALLVTGDRGRSIPGDFAADVALSGAGVAAGKPALGSVRVTGVVRGSAIEVTGNVGAVTVGAFRDSSLLLGSDGLASPVLRLASFTATGLPADPTQAAFADATVAAGMVGRVTLQSVGTTRPAETFGVTATVSLAGLKVATPAFLYDAGQPSPQGLSLDGDAGLEFVVRVG